MKKIKIYLLTLLSLGLFCVIYLLVTPMEPRPRELGQVFFVSQQLERTWPNSHSRRKENIREGLSRIAETGKTYRLLWSGDIEGKDDFVIVAIEADGSNDVSKILVLHSKKNFAAEVTKQSVKEANAKVMRKKIEDGNLIILCRVEFINKE